VAGRNKNDEKDNKLRNLSSEIGLPDQGKRNSVDARQNFGIYDRVIILDTGLLPLDEEKVLEFYDYVQVPVEIMPVELDNFKEIISHTCEGVL